MRKTVIILLSCTLLLLIGYAGLRGYRIWKRDHMIGLAREFAAKKDLRNAVLSLNQVLHANPRDAEASRLMAELAEAAGSPDAFLWRSRVVEAVPDSIDDRMALARAAMAMRDFASASNALEGITVEGRKTFAYQNLAGTLATASGQFPAAEIHFTEAARLSPDNPVPRLNLAVLSLASTNEAAAAEARSTLEQLSGEAYVSCQALRELVNDSMRRGQTDRAAAFSDRLIQQTNSVFADQLLRLDVLRAAQDAQFDTRLAALQRQSLQDRAELQQMAGWLISRTGHARALTWLDSLPAETRTNQPVNMIAADCQLVLKQWPALQASLERQNWDQLEFLRHAFLARAMREQDLASSAKTEWELALKETKGRKAPLTMLLQTAGKWGWNNEAEQILWTLVNQFPSEKWAAAALAELLFTHSRSDALLRLYSQLSKANPNDFSAKNNLAMLALLLDAPQFEPHQLARDIYNNSPTNATYLSTYAFSLYRQDKPADALQLLERLNPHSLEQPGIAAYYAVFLSANGQHDKAKKYFDLAAKASLLPEERKLLEQARRL